MPGPGVHDRIGAGAVTICACGCGRPIKGRPQRCLRRDCYDRAGRADTLLDFPRPTRSHLDTAEDVAALHGRGLDLHGIAEQLGLRPGSVVRALERHRDEAGLDPATTAALVALRAELGAQRRAARTDEQRARVRASKRASYHRRRATA